VAGVGIVLAVYNTPPLRYTARTAITTTTAHLSPAATTPFPDVEVSGLDDAQQRILSLAKAEYEKRPISYNADVLRYTQGAKDAWCADFVSWTMQQSGAPYTNPNSGSWRIPGEYTLKEYYESQGEYHEVGSYRPKTGDVAIFVGRHTADLFSTAHVALVIKVEGDTMTTLGGNEGGRLRLDTQQIAKGVNSLVGFGEL